MKALARRSSKRQQQFALDCVHRDCCMGVSKLQRLQVQLEQSGSGSGVVSCFAGNPPGKRTYGGDQFRLGDRLGQVQVGPAFVTSDPFIDGCTRAHHDDPQPRLYPLEARGEAEAVFAGQVQIEEYQVERIGHR